MPVGPGADANGAFRRALARAARSTLRRVPNGRSRATGASARLQVRVNNYPLAVPRIEAGWIVYELPPTALASGENLIGVALEAPSADGPASLEKLEVHALF